MASEKTVDTPHKLYAKFYPKWQRCRDVYDGQDAVHEAGTRYLPKLNEEKNEDYQARKMRAGFYNATCRTLDGLQGMLFRKPPRTDFSGIPESYLSDVDMAGTSFGTFKRKVAFEIFLVGWVGILVDHPPSFAGEAVLATAQAQGLRPTMQVYQAESIRNWRYSRINNRWRLTQVRLREVVEEPLGEYGVEEITQYRVLEINEQGFYQQRLLRKRNGVGEFVQYGDEIIPTMNGQRLSEIPFSVFGPDGRANAPDEPTLIDLVDVNLSHYRTNADYEHGCHFTGLPTPYVCGINQEEAQNGLFIGSKGAWALGDPNAKVGFLEFSGQGLGALKENLDRKEQQMAILGARMLFAERRQTEAAETASIHRTGENSVLANLASGVSEAMEWALGVFSLWSGGNGRVVYQINKDYNPASLDSSELTALLKAVQVGQLSGQEFFALLQKAEIIDPEQDYETHQEQIGQQGPARPDTPSSG